MDYLNIIATRSLILFPTSAATKPAHHRTFSSSSGSSLNTSPSTPTTSLPRPGPVTMAIHSLMSSDTDCAYYLLTHLLTHPSMFPSSLHLGDVSKEVAGEAEVMVWCEIDKAKMFIRTLGEWFANHPEGISESQLGKLAEAWGLGWKGEKDEHELELIEDVNLVTVLEESAVVAWLWHLRIAPSQMTGFVLMEQPSS